MALTTITLPDEVLATIEALAEREARSRSNMVAVLVREALTNRGEVFTKQPA